MSFSIVLALVTIGSQPRLAAGNSFAADDASTPVSSRSEGSSTTPPGGAVPSASAVREVAQAPSSSTPFGPATTTSASEPQVGAVSPRPEGVDPFRQAATTADAPANGGTLASGATPLHAGSLPPPPRPAGVAATVYPELPVRYRISGFFDVTATRVGDRVYRGFDGSDRVLPGLAAGLRADVPVASSRFFLGGGLAYRGFFESGNLEGIQPNSLTVHEALVHVRASARIVDGFDLYVEPGGGPSVHTVEFDEAPKQTKVAGMFNALGGVALYFPKAWLPRRGSSRATLGLDAGFGYAYRSPVDLTLRPDRTDDPIPARSTPLGDLQTSGFTFRTGLFLSFL